LDLAYEAGRSTLALFNTGHEVELKKDNSPVTLADKAAEKIVRAALAKKFPDEGILGEEEGEGGSRERRWVVDPIDGTKSFICGVPIYATLLSYEVEGIPQLGVCYFPALDEMLYAEIGGGTFLNGRRCHVSAKSDISGSVLCCGSHTSMEKYGRDLGFMKLARQSLATRTWSDAYGHALVASGRVEAMIDPIVNRWDVSAMQIIVEEAGGRFTTFTGEATPQVEAVSSNGLLHEQILESFS
jgi:histidinol phosphatase-like enzyme (inositol monophosphatase family)